MYSSTEVGEVFKLFHSIRLYIPKSTQAVPAIKIGFMYMNITVKCVTVENVLPYILIVLSTSYLTLWFFFIKFHNLTLYVHVFDEKTQSRVQYMLH